MNRYIVLAILILLSIGFCCMGSELYPPNTDFSFDGLASWSQPKLASGTTTPPIASAAEGELFLNSANAASPSLLVLLSGAWRQVAGSSEGGGDGVSTDTVVAYIATETANRQAADASVTLLIPTTFGTMASETATDYAGKSGANVASTAFTQVLDQTLIGGGGVATDTMIAYIATESIDRIAGDATNSLDLLNHVNITVPIASGGTGGVLASEARTNIDVYSKSESDAMVAQSNLRYYFTESSSDVAGFEAFAVSPVVAQASEAITLGTSNALLDQWITPPNKPNITTLLSGVYEASGYLSKTGAGSMYMTLEFWVYDSVGSPKFLVASSAPFVFSGVVVQQLVSPRFSAAAASTILATDRLAVKLYGYRSGVAAATFWYGGVSDGYFSVVISPRNYARTDGSNIASSAFSANLDKTVLSNYQTATYTLVLSDAGKLIRMATASTTTGLQQSILIPPVASVAWPIGTVVNFSRADVGDVRIAGAITDVVINSSVTNATTPWLMNKFSGASAVYLGTDVWDLWGALKNGN